MRSRAVLLAYAVFVIYGSLVPLDFVGLPLGEAWRRFQQIPFFELGIESRADWVANGVLYFPLGFLAARAMALGLGGRPWLGAMLSVAACCGLAAVVEFTQLFFPARTVSQNDLIAEFIGSAVGAVIAPMANPWYTRLVRAWGNGGAAFSQRFLEVYAVMYVAQALFPYDLLLSRAELLTKFHSDGLGWAFAPNERGGLFVGVQLLVEVALAVPMGLLLVRQRPGPVGMAARGLILGLAIEGAQFFIASGDRKSVV